MERDDADRGATPVADIVREYGPFAATEKVGGVTYDGKHVWFATGDRMQSFEPESGQTGRALHVEADAGSTFDGEHFFQLAHGMIQKIDPHTGAVLSTIASPAGSNSAGLTWAEGKLWVADYRGRAILQIDPATGSVLSSIASTRFVTGVTFVEGELWHGTWENEESELRRVDPKSGEILDAVKMPDGVFVSGLEADGRDLFYCGSGSTAKVRSVRRPKRR